jgi:hypothetical protein
VSIISPVNCELKRKSLADLKSWEYRCKENFTGNSKPMNGIERKITLNGEPLNACLNYYTVV